MGQLAGPVRPKVGMDDRIIVADDAVDALDDSRSDELVVLAAGVRGLHRRCRGDGALAHGVDDGVVALLDALPATVTIHAEPSPAKRCDSCVGVGGGEPRFEIANVAEGGPWRRVA